MVAKSVNLTDKVLNILKNYTYLSIATGTSVVGIMLQFFTDILTRSYTCKGWVIMLVFVLLFVIVGIIEIVRLRVQTSRWFYKNDKVRIEGYRDMYVVQGYKFFNPDICICHKIKTGEIMKIPQVALELYGERKPSFRTGKIK